MLLGPGTSTPFSVSDILRCELEPLGAEAWPLRSALGHLESSRYLPQNPEQGRSEVQSANRSGNHRSLDEAEPLGGPCEMVSKRDSERAGNPGEYELGLRVYSTIGV